MKTNLENLKMTFFKFFHMFICKLCLCNLIFFHRK